jgi:hypothetical protein
LLDVISEKPTKENPATEPWTADQKFRWPWWVGLKPIILLPADERSPHVDEVNFDPRRRAEWRWRIASFIFLNSPGPIGR